MKIEGFVRHELEPAELGFWVGALPEDLRVGAEGFAAIWALRPDTFLPIHIHGRLVASPRWQQAFGRDYRYSGQTNTALPVPAGLAPFLDWAKGAIDPRLNGILLNWYDAGLGHYIGPHRDSRAGLVPGTPIVTISLGHARKFRLRRWRDKAWGFRDWPTADGSVFVTPWETNLAYTHEVPPAAKSATGRRISVTLRAFEDEERGSAVGVRPGS